MSEMQFEVVLLGGVNDAAGMAKQAGVHKLATELRQRSITVQVIDHLVILMNEPVETQEAILSRYLSPATIIVGLSNTMLITARTVNNPQRHFWGVSEEAYEAFIKLLRRLAPNAKIVHGGAQTKFSTQVLFDAEYWDRFSDFYVVGQAERSFVAIFNHLKWGDPIHVKEELGSTKWVDETSYPYDDFSSSRMLWEHNDFVESHHVLPIEIARGCVFKCAYCSFKLLGKKWGEFTREKDIIRQEMISNYERFGVTKYFIMDDTINDSMEKVEFIHDLMTSLPFQPIWIGYCRLDLFWKFPDMARLLYEAGMRSTLLGLETLDDEAGKKIGKGLGRARIDQTLTTLKQVWGDNVHITGMFILGLPGEQIESMHRTLAWCKDASTHIHKGIFAALYVEPKAGMSRMEKDAQKFGLTTDNVVDWVSDITSYREMVSLEYQFNYELTLDIDRWYTFSTGWTIFGALNIGFSLEEVRTLPFEEGKQIFRARRLAAIDQYKRTLLEWVPPRPILPLAGRHSDPVLPK